MGIRSGSGSPRDLAPALTLVDLAGERIDTTRWQGKVVLVNFWAAWCTPCAEEVPQLMALQDKYRAAGFQTIGISMEDKESALRDFYRKYKMNYPVVIGNQKIAQEYGGILGLPTTFLIGRDGRIHAKHSGSADFPSLEQEIVSLLRAGT
jgi:peroxiredoxin